MNKAVQQLFIVLVVISGTAILAFESKNTSEDDNNIDIEYDYHRNLAEFQNPDKLSGGERQLCTETKTQAFSPYDYAVVIAMLAVSLKIGLFYGFCHKGSLEPSSSDFMLGSQMSLFPVTLSLTTSFVTAIELLGNPAEMFFYGSQFALIGEYRKSLLGLSEYLSLFSTSKSPKNSHKITKYVHLILINAFQSFQSSQ